ncbi:hypothetical protein METESE_34320 [Mesoterricola sediminis]|uniref:HD-GYP domain-containing protein n=2 Tax=Mesoterricola sediminis TaxID=2927980 RepID=A0AA48GVB6_9BACT|nr:hypothetical protein METESE_34320 [Mesoterricola sediminis]
MPALPPGLNEPLQQRLAQVLYRCLEDLGTTKAAFYMLDPATRGFDLAVHYGWPRNMPPPAHLPPLDPLLVMVSREKRGLAVNDSRGSRELQAFSAGSEHPRFHLAPVYDRGEWRGLLIQRDPPRGGAFEPERQDPVIQSICEDFVEALRTLGPADDLETWPGDTPALEPQATAQEEVPALRVHAPPPAALARIEPAAGTGTAPAWGGTGTSGSATALARTSSPGDPFKEILAGDPEAFLPEQQTFFWETANLLCRLAPSTAVALWLSDPADVRPLLAYSRFPLSNDLKHQLIGQTLAQVSRLKRKDIRLLLKAEWPERDPVAGHFATVLPVFLEEEVGEDNLLMLLRIEDRPFTAQEQEDVRQVSRMLGFYLQEVRLHERYHQAFLSVSHRILSSAEGRLPAIRAHSVNTAERSRDLARRLELSTAEVEAVSISAILHDVGTLLLDYRVLDKPRLSSEELAQVRTHPLLASTFLKDLYFPFNVLEIIRHHHENWDGSGYPSGLQGEAIPIGSRIIRLVEAYEMMTSPTPYRAAKPEDEALVEIRKLSGTHFDPGLVAAFLDLLGH